MGYREHGLTLFTAILWLIGIGVIAQLWLVAGALEALLARHREILLPAFLASAAMGLLNGGLLWFVIRLDRRIRRQAGPAE